MAAAPVLPDYQDQLDHQPQPPQIAPALDPIPYDLTTLSDAAQRLCVSVATVRNWVRKGVVPVYTLVNGYHRVSLAELISKSVKTPDKRFVEETDAGVRVYLDGRPNRRSRKR